MIISIDDLKIPTTLSCSVEKFNHDKINRAASGRMIKKTSPTEKWRATLSYGNKTVPREFQYALYNKCQIMRKKKLPVTLISEYDGITYTVDMLCVNALPPKVLAFDENDIPRWSGNIGATFEEV